MSIQIPQNMAEVQVQLTERRNQGEQISEDTIIKNAVKDILQALMDEALEGHYDDVKWDADEHDLIICDIMGKPVGKASPAKESFIADFKADPDTLMLRFDDVVTKIVGGR